MFFKRYWMFFYSVLQSPIEFMSTVKKMWQIAACLVLFFKNYLPFCKLWPCRNWSGWIHCDWALRGIVSRYNKTYTYLSGHFALTCYKLSFNDASTRHEKSWQLYKIWRDVKYLYYEIHKQYISQRVILVLRLPLFFSNRNRLSGHTEFLVLFFKSCIFILISITGFHHHEHCAQNKPRLVVFY